MVKILEILLLPVFVALAGLVVVGLGTAAVTYNGVYYIPELGNCQPSPHEL
ncbi:MAG: hypothetical protein F6K16_10680 [Symploca sp. SIO2B6]|nr:hypothetical protein [Symploca sp. SIO2B6]